MFFFSATHTLEVCGVGKCFVPGTYSPNSRTRIKGEVPQRNRKAKIDDLINLSLALVMVIFFQWIEMPEGAGGVF